MKQMTKLYSIPFIGTKIKTRDEKLTKALTNFRFKLEKPVRQMTSDILCDFLVLNNLPLSEDYLLRFRQKYDRCTYKLYNKLFESGNITPYDDVEKFKNEVNAIYTNWEKFFVLMVRAYVLKCDDKEFLNKCGIKVERVSEDTKLQEITDVDVTGVNAKPTWRVSFHSNYERFNTFKKIILLDNRDFIVENVYGLAMYIKNTPIS